ncbi:MAG: hypothetical protein KKA67_01355 [Spirochaetes bacterium]|nr:hypothetical protein [Spirochaetota bacterium]MBU1079224.1 hypothetical protein [Spirochaetota bacterium]
MKIAAKNTLRKAAIIVIGLSMISAIVILTSAPVQSRFVEARHGGALVFMDKYVPRPLRAEFSRDLGEATEGFLLEAGLLEAIPPEGPVAFFAGDRHYGVISADDPLIRKRLAGRPSSDFVLFRSIGMNFYANELVTRSVAAQDGSYVFVNVDEDWRASALHAYAHAIAAANAPAAVKASFKPDQGFDPDLRFAFRFADETLALLASDLFELSLGLGGADGAWDAFPEASARRYAGADSDVMERQAEIIMATYDLPQKSAVFYAACNSFASWILRERGADSLRAVARSFFSGAYSTLDEAFSPIGGFYASVEAWKGDASIPL